MSRTTSVEKQIEKTVRYMGLYGARESWLPKNPEQTAQQLVSERWYAAEHIRANNQPTVVGRTHDLLTDDGEPDVYGLLTEFLFSRGVIQRTGEPEFFPTYVVVAGGRLIPYDVEHTGKSNEKLLVWI